MDSTFIDRAMDTDRRQFDGAPIPPNRLIGGPTSRAETEQGRPAMPGLT
jgi:hypothetical protein